MDNKATTPLCNCGDSTIVFMCIEQACSNYDKVGYCLKCLEEGKHNHLNHKIIQKFVAEKQNEINEGA